MVVASAGCFVVFIKGRLYNSFADRFGLGLEGLLVCGSGLVCLG